MADVGDKRKLEAHYLLIALLPALVFSVNQLLLRNYAEPWDILPERIAEFHAYREGTARIGMLAAFMLFFGVAMAGLLFFAISLRIFEWKRRMAMVAGFLLFAGAAIGLSAIVKDRSAEDYAGVSLFCIAAGYGEEQTLLAKTREAEELRRSGKASGAGVAVKYLPRHADCPYDRFTAMRDLANWQFGGVCFAFAALVLAGIFCLAGPPAPNDGAARPKAQGGETAAVQPHLAGADLPHWERQSEWLNACLYLSALLLASALAFTNAFLQWPDFVLLDAKDRDAYVASMVSYYGITFSVMLASFYIPVAAILAGRVRAAGGKLPEAFKGPRQIGKIVLGLSSTALAGAIPGVLELFG